MKYIFNLLVILLFVSISNQPLKADTYYLDFKYILNESDAGKKANKTLQNQFDQGVKTLKDKEKKLQKEEKDIIQQKKLLSPEEYKKKITVLRTKVSSLQKERNSILESVSKKRRNARNQLLGALNPIVKDFMAEKNIKLVLDKKSILLGDENLDITKDIMVLLNKKMKSINLN
jgi:Skp family chaperone for outer membrane proteins